MTIPGRAQPSTRDNFLVNRLPEPYRSQLESIPVLVDRLDPTIKANYPQIEDGLRRRTIEILLLILKDSWPHAPDEQLTLGVAVMFPASRTVIGPQAFDATIRENVKRRLIAILGPCCELHSGNWRDTRGSSLDGY